MGDISYVVYLVHWPIIVLCKYHRNVYELATDGKYCDQILYYFSILFCKIVPFFRKHQRNMQDQDNKVTK